jgi:hypothetical protein
MHGGFLDKLAHGLQMTGPLERGLRGSMVGFGMLEARHYVVALGVLVAAAVGCAKSDCNRACPRPTSIDADTCTCRPTAGASGNGAPDDYACGAAMCDANTQTCEHLVGGAPPGVDNYSCIAIPAPCANDVSCACLKMALSSRGADDCEGDARHLTVRVDVP